MENPIKMDDLGVPLFSETPKCSPDPNLFCQSVGNLNKFDAFRERSSILDSLGGKTANVSR